MSADDADDVSVERATAALVEAARDCEDEDASALAGLWRIMPPEALPLGARRVLSLAAALVEAARIEQRVEWAQLVRDEGADRVLLDPENPDLPLLWNGDEN